MKLSKAEERRREELAEKLEAAGQEVNARFAELLKLLTDAEHDVNKAIRDYNKILLEAEAFVEGVAEEMRDSFDDKSERWQDSDKGQSAAAFVEEWEQFEASELREVAILMPELEEEPCHATELRELPAESDE